VGGTQHLPGFSYTTGNFNLRNERHETMLYNVGDDFTNLLQLSLREGQPLLPTPADQPAQTVLVNETFVREFGEGRPLIGESIELDSATYRIGGVVRDFMTNTPFRPIASVIIRPVAARQFSYLVARVPAAHQKEVYAELEKTWKRLFPYKPFDGFYQDQALAEAEDVSTTVAHTMAVFALVTILLAVSGLFSLISLNVLKRTREVAIRRVLGATGTQIGWLLNKSYLWILAAAVGAGCSGGYLLGVSLMDSIFKINNGIPTGALIGSAIGVLAVAIFTILIKLWQTLRINPADSLKAD
jgi:putative ABC transport system permease protein